MGSVYRLAGNTVMVFVGMALRPGAACSGADDLRDRFSAQYDAN